MSEERSFHGLASFYIKLIKNFSLICNVMIEKIRGDKKYFKWTQGDFKWTQGVDKSFEALK